MKLHRLTVLVRQLVRRMEVRLWVVYDRLELPIDAKRCFPLMHYGCPLMQKIMRIDAANEPAGTALMPGGTGCCDHWVHR